MKRETYDILVSQFDSDPVKWYEVFKALLFEMVNESEQRSERRKNAPKKQGSTKKKSETSETTTHTTHTTEEENKNITLKSNTTTQSVATEVEVLMQECKKEFQKEQVGNIVLTKKTTEPKTTTEIKEKKEKKQPDPEVTECMEMVKNYNGGIIEWAEGQQRKYAKLLIDKIKKIESIQTGKTTWQEVLNLILSIISNNKYHSSKIASPEKIYYNITTLMQVCKQEGKTQQQNNQVLTEV